MLDLTHSTQNQHLHPWPVTLINACHFKIAQFWAQALCHYSWLKIEKRRFIDGRGGGGGHIRHEILQYITRNKEVWGTLSIAWCYKSSRCSNTTPLGFRIPLSPWLPAVHRPPSGPGTSFSWICLSSPVLSPFGGREGFSDAHGNRKSGKDEKIFFFSFFFFLQGGSSHSTGAHG